MAKKSRGKAVAAYVGSDAPGRPNRGVSSPASGRKVSGGASTKRAKGQTLANGTKTGIMRLPSNG